MKINRDNYEAFLLDLQEGRLSVDEQKHLHDFLQINPDCEALSPESEPWILEGSQVPFPGREQLKREFPTPSTLLTDHNFDLFSIARVEGDLTGEQEEAHRSMVTGDERRYRQWLEWQQTQLVSEPLLFKGKDRLKHKSGQRNRVIWMSMISAAAAVALLIILLRTEPVVPQQELTLQTATEEKAQQTFDVPEQTTPDLPVQKSKKPMMFSVKKEQDRPVELESKNPVVPQDDLQPRPIRVSENRLNGLSLVGEAVSDQIEPLYIPPVSIHWGSLSVAQISKMDIQEVLEDYAEERDISLWTIASAGIKGINKIAGSDISLLASRDEEGEVSGFQLWSRRFSLTRPLGQEK